MPIFRKIADALRARPRIWAAIGAVVFAGAVVGAVGVSLSGSESAPDVKEIRYSEFSAMVRDGKVAEVTVAQNEMEGLTKDGEKFRLYHEGWLYKYETLGDLSSKGVKVEFPKREGLTVFSLMAAVITYSTPVLFLVVMAAMAWVIWLQMKNAFSPSWPPVSKGHTVKFADVAGQDEAKFELEEIVTFLESPEEYSRLKAKTPRGVLMIGDPGNGKTLIAKALAGECGASFIAVSGSEFSSMWAGVGRQKMEKLFKEARKKAPCIIFIDEIDAVARRRGGTGGDVGRDSDSTQNQLLIEMDGFKETEGVVVIGATNLIELIDPALLRAGRFDRRVQVQRPDINGRRAILEVHMKGRPIASDVDAMTLARGTPGYSGADLMGLVNEASVLAARQKAPMVTASHFEGARDKMLLGLERKGMVLDESERRVIAAHEAGHAVVATLRAGSDKVHAATIIPRGGALGMVMRLPERDHFIMPRSRLLADLAVAMGGRAAEEIVFGADSVSNGAAADIRYATDIARNMVTKWGMSSAVGMMFISNDQAEGSKIVDDEVRRIIDASYAEAKALLVKHRAALDAVEQSLLNQETLTGDQVRSLVAGAQTLVTPAKPRRVRRRAPEVVQAA